MNYKRLLNLYIPLVDFIADIIGSHCEVLLHDIVDVENSVIAIRNGYISGRYLGCPLTDLGLKLLENKAYLRQNAIVNYRSRTADGKKLISSTYYIKDDKGELIGMLCVNILDSPDHPITRMPSRLPLEAVAGYGMGIGPGGEGEGDRRARGKEGVQEDVQEKAKEKVQGRAKDKVQGKAKADTKADAGIDSGIDTKADAEENVQAEAQADERAYARDDPKEEVAELLSTSLDYVVNEAVKKVMAKYKVPGERMSTEEKSAVVRQLRESGIFKIKGSIAKVAKALRTSESTIYRYLTSK
ncbi:dna-binding yheo uncharacterized bacteria similar hi0575 containing transcription regulator helix-turn-helix [Acididesulfobacillus acetoxydans]|uniref:Dna-binding yheo uncharacterized bacteria similar hi0575 containing transcription regulator helix-turn-helix n=1 Tax=Acididesulfobacillus acetoxydans TaxID=1561005 RepID=A0A8S0W668_9FIRM|nr:transcriptional regulator [Acididesulfobacillus acetoxydans]CAA7599539.1 dna-binding yheo uncharacterized bacteria similar hi0575 containing transcription regulator helix-turn-helix [Acididesulfobacillus acetoxydans]CEJ07734.1 PAC domain-containing protein [Acididesulfobacillus acetoxydans]